MRKSYFLHTAILLIALLWGATPGWAVPLTQSVTFNDWTKLVENHANESSGYDKFKGDQIFPGSDGVDYTWNFYNVMPKDGKPATATYIQLKNSTGVLTSPSFETQHGFQVTVIHTGTLTLEETGTDNSVSGSSTLTLTVSSTNASITLKKGSSTPHITQIEITPLANAALQDPELTFTDITGDVTKELSEGSYSSVATTVSDAPIVYRSSNTDVATIENGAVTLHAKGTTVIKAEVAETETFNAASIQYTLTVIDPASMTTFVKVTNGTVTDGKYIIVYQDDENATSVRAMNTTNTKDYFEYSTVNLSDGKIITDNEAIIWDITTEANGSQSISNGGNLFVGYKGSSNYAYIYDSYTEKNCDWTFKYDSEKNVFSCTNGSATSRTLKYNTSSPRFACYTSAANLTLYRVDTGKSDATISFNDIEGTTCEKMLTDGSYNSTATTTSDAPIFYSSSNQEVATIDQEGLVTLKAGGTTVIKAEVDETETHTAASVEYTLRVIDPADIKTFEKVTDGSISDGLYILAYQSPDDANSIFAMSSTNTNDYFAANAINLTEGQITTYDQSVMWNITLESDGNYSISNNGIYVAYNGFTSDSKGNNAYADAEYTSDRAGWIIEYDSNENEYLFKNAKVNKRFLQYNPSANPKRFACYYNESQQNITLYRLSDGKTDVAVTFNEVSGDKTLFFEEGYTYNSAATADPERPITYSSSNQEVATIDATGVVTLVGPGTTVIKATTEADDTYREGVAQYTLTVQASSVTLPYSTDFKSGLGDWISATTVGSALWTSDSQYGAKISGYINGKNTESEAYLISPAVTANNIILNFSSWFNYDGNALELLYSTDYDPNTMQPTDATWNNISENATWPTETFKWVESGDIELQDFTSPIRFAFRYTSTTDGASTWEITDLTIKEGLASGIATVEANGMKVINGKGEITIVTDTPASVAIYTLTGAQVRQIELAEGNNVVTLPAGIYIINRQKVVVF